MAKVKVWHRLAADEIKGKLYKLSKSRRWTTHMISKSKVDIVEEDMTLLMYDVIHAFIEDAAKIIANHEEAADGHNQ